MKDKDPPRSSSEEDALEREILSDRTFSLVAAIGRMGGDLLKGTSPVTKKRQAELAIDHYLRKNLLDAEGALRVVLLRRAAESELLLEGYEQPFEALSGVIESLLGSEQRLQAFVAQIDMEWGHLYSERPYFEIEGRPPNSEDPYTFASVRSQLVQLLAKLNGDTPG